MTKYILQSGENFVPKKFFAWMYKMTEFWKNIVFQVYYQKKNHQRYAKEKSG